MPSWLSQFGRCVYAPLPLSTALAIPHRYTPAATGLAAKRKGAELHAHAETFEHWREHQPRPSFVYLISEWDRDTEEPTGFAKIGYAADPIARLNALRTGNPRHLQLNGLFFGGQDAERAMHRRWRHTRVAGEWFNNFELLHLVFAEIDRRQREMTAPLRCDLDGVVDDVNRYDLATGQPIIENFCTGKMTCDCNLCTGEREHRVKRGIRPRQPMPRRRAA